MTSFGSNFFTPNGSDTSTEVALVDNSGVAYVAKCTGTPPTTASKYGHGCLMIRTDSGDGNAALYENTGTEAIPVWNLVGSISPGEITLTENQLLVGASGDVAGDAGDSLTYTPASHPTPDIFQVGISGDNGEVVGFADNRTSMRTKGLQAASEGGAEVQSNMGIFYNDAYTTLGTLKTRASWSGNLEMDVILQSPHALLLVAVDDTQTDGKIHAASQTFIDFDTRCDAEVLGGSRLRLDRLDTSTTGATNISDVVMSVTSGNLALNSPLLARLGATTGGLRLRKVEATTTFVGGATENIATQVPTGATVIGVQLRVDTAITFGGGGVTWSAAYNTGSTQAIATAQAATKNTKVNTMFDPNGNTPITSAATDITITPDVGTLTAGVVRAIVYYLDFEAMADAA